LAALVAAAALTFACGPARGEKAPPPEPDHYRTDQYRDPTPLTLHGARVVTTTEAEAIWRRGKAAFVDVLPRPPKPANLPAGTIWHERPRLNIPGSIWLPDTGYGALAPATAAYLRNGLVKATGGDRDKTLVFYCLRSCWMSWNAARRAVAMGYTGVVWFPDGTDGWEDELLPLKPCAPEPRPAE
jgi:PQQ-dependent catabolism-associated CXXCW motif protein